MAFAQKQDGQWVALSPSAAVHYMATFDVQQDDGTSKPETMDLVASYETVSAWSDAERAAAGIYTVGEGDPVPVGKRVVSSSIADKKGRPVWVNVLADLPPEDPASAASLVDAERDRRIRDGITFGGTVFQTDDTSRERIEKARVSGLTALQSGVQAGDLRWTGVGSDFFWIALDNTRVPMDAPTTVAFGSAVAAREGLIIVAASDLKKRITAGETIANIGDDSLWP